MKRLLILLLATLLIGSFSTITLAESSLYLDLLVNSTSDWQNIPGDLAGYILGYTYDSDTFGFGLEAALASTADYSNELDFTLNNIYGSYNFIKDDQLSLAVTLAWIAINEAGAVFEYPLDSIQLGLKFNYQFSDLLGIGLGFGYGISNSGEDEASAIEYDSVDAYSYGIKLFFSPSESFDLTAGYRVYGYDADDAGISYHILTVGGAYNF